jgi:hypothetical protein
MGRYFYCWIQSDIILEKCRHAAQNTLIHCMQPTGHGLRILVIKQLLTPYIKIRVQNHWITYELWSCVISTSMNLKACSWIVYHGLVSDKGAFYYSFQNLGSWHANKLVSQVPVLCIFHSGMLVIKESNRFVKIKAI